MNKIYISGILSFLFILSASAQTQEVTITPTCDNTIFANTELSNGQSWSFITTAQLP